MVALCAGIAGCFGPSSTPPDGGFGGVFPGDGVSGPTFDTEVLVLSSPSRLLRPDEETQLRVQVRDGSGALTDLPPTQARFQVLDRSIVDVSPSGVITAVGLGTTVISAQRDTDRLSQGNIAVRVVADNSRRIVITPGDVHTTLDAVIGLHAVVEGADGVLEDVTARATWSTTLPYFGQFDSPGRFRVRALSGFGYAIADWGDAHSEPVSITVTQQSVPIVVSALPTVATVRPAVACVAGPPGRARFALMAGFQDAPRADLIAESEFTAEPSSLVTTEGLPVGEVRAAGPETGEATVTITVTRGSVFTVGAQVIVAPCVTEFAIEPASAALAVGASRSFATRARWSDARSEAPASGVAWASSDPSVLRVDATTGEATGLTAGTARVRATFTPVGDGDSVTREAEVTVGP